MKVRTSTIARDEIETFVADNSSLFNPVFDLSARGDGDWLTDSIDVEEVSLNLRQCSNRSAPGPDGISYLTIKHLSNSALTKLTAIYNYCLLYGYFPSRWKQAYGTMIPKPSNDPKQPSSYRPISLLPALGKLLEQIFVRRLNLHLEGLKFFNDYQHAYRRGKNGSEILHCLVDEVRSMSSSVHRIAAISLDVEKAFDSVWHDGLRYELYSIGLSESTLRFLSSFLQNRSIQVRVNGVLSQPVPLLAGTPQGSVLSPLLFNIYVNDLSLERCQGSRGEQFADDISAWTTAKSNQLRHVCLQKA